MPRIAVVNAAVKHWASIVTIVGVFGALAIWRLALAAHLNFLFERPAALWIAPRKPAAALQPAE